ncbi:hypothetical protein [Bradyrhizobium sp. McL0615]|uniref:hypothetical protein n=1 Tax=Bradyrhizobium sp. McL0615 TaxID=3415673 RepID=UPI003CF35F93
MFGSNRNDWHADHGMSCENPNTSSRTIHLTSQQQAAEAAYYYCAPDGNQDKGHVMTTVNTEGYVSVWFSPKPTFRNVSKVCWDQNITDLGGGKWTVVNFLTPAEYGGKTDLGYTSPDFPKNGGPSSPQGPAANGVKVFRGSMNSYTNNQFHEGARGLTVSDKAARYKHCVIDNGNGTLTTTIAQPNGTTVSRTVAGNIPDGDIRVQFGDDSYNPDKHFDARGVASNSTGLYTWHWDNIQIYATSSQGGGNTLPIPTVAFSASPPSISASKISTVTWSSTNATSCAAGGGWTGTKATSGTLAVSPPSTTNYTLACTGAGGTSPVASATVAVSTSPALINGACGSANGTTVSSVPTTNLCSTGTSSAVAGSGPWTWGCGGSNGGATASCSASVSVASGGTGSGSTPGSGSSSSPTPVVGNCGLQLGGAVSFCETFDKKNPGIQSRTGDLDPNVWGVSRTQALVNFGQGLANAYPASTIVGCNGSTKVLPPNDIQICNGQLRQSSNDNPTGGYEGGGVTVLAMYPKQPFDFAGRTGTVSFEVSNDSQGSHGAWPEFWMTNLPVPAPFAHFETWRALPQYGFGLRFDGFVDSNGNPNPCPEGNNNGYLGVGSAILINNYVANDFDTGGSLQLRGYACVKKATQVGQMNHYELRISQNQIDIYGTDAGVAPSPTTLKHLATILNANLGFTRGLIWLQDVHYNADKSLQLPLQHDHTFAWDNVAFDGPFTYRDFSYDALDANVPVNNYAPNLANNLGKASDPNNTSTWNVLNIPTNPKAATVRVLFNFFHSDRPSVLNVTVNGHTHPTPWPYPDTTGFTWRTFAVTIPASDLIAGTNVVQIGGDQPLVTSNVNIVLVDVPGGVPVLPGSNNSYPAGGVSASQ